MIVSVNLSQEVYDYYKDYDLSDIANALLKQYDFTCLPAKTGGRDKEIRVNVTDPTYIQLYKVVGPRSKKVSLARLFEFGYNMDALCCLDIKPTKNEDNPFPTLMEKVYRTLLEAQKYTDNPCIKDMIEIARLLKKGG